MGSVDGVVLILNGSAAKAGISETEAATDFWLGWVVESDNCQKGWFFLKTVT